MSVKRKLRRPGEILLLGDTEYRLEAVEGSGSSAVVYRASYADCLNGACRHEVLVKELFPYCSGGEIYRDEDGNICCREGSQALMEHCRKSFYLGNQANLQLLKLAPERISGNINSYKAYGTFYSVLTVHGGRNLERILEAGEGAGTLRETAVVIRKILDAVECFHRNRILHLDISPDNILLLPERAMLIDYNSVWNMDDGEYRPSEKEGYSAPEIALEDYEDICPATDLFSVCAVWFRMLTGRKLTKEELAGKGIRKCFPSKLPVFQGEPMTAVWKTVQIMVKGLHVLPRRRYLSVEELREDVEELIRRIDGRGISHSALWESSRRDWKLLEQEEEDYLDRSIQVGTEGIRAQKICGEMLFGGGKILLKGPGGMGKTRFLTDLWGKSVRTYRADAPVVMYIPLADYQEMGEEAFYLQKYLVRRLNYRAQAANPEEAIHELNRQLDCEGGWKLILLLDGLNEAGSTRRLLLKEMEQLARKPSVGILLTDRSDSVKEYALCDFQTAELLPLEEQVMERELEKGGIRPPKQDGLRKLLCNPMMLFLYRKTVRMSEENGTPMQKADAADTVEDMVGLYLNSLHMRQQQIDAGNQAEALRHRYLLCHFLPEIAGEMKRRRKTLLTVPELCSLAEKSYRTLGRKDFSMAFPEYLGKSRLMLDGMDSGMEWFDYAVDEQLENRLNLIRKSQDGNYCLAHDNFMGYLAGQAAANRRLVLRCRRKRNGKWIGAAVLLMTALAAGGCIRVRQTQAALQENAQDSYWISETLYRIGCNLSDLGAQLDWQQQVLKSALKSAALEGDADGLAAFQDVLDRVRSEASGYSYQRSDDWSVLDELRAEGMEESAVGMVKELMESTYDMDVIMEEGLAHLEKNMYRPVVTSAEREEMAMSYQHYLDSYAETVCRELNLILAVINEDKALEMLKMIENIRVFRDDIRFCSYEGKSMETLETELHTAQSLMKSCILDMKLWNYGISLEEWE